MGSLVGDAWILVEDDEGFKGVLVMVDPSSGEAITLSCRNRRDCDRWTVMPSLSKYPSLTTLDLFKDRYLMDLDDSIGQLANLRRLCLVRCKRLVRLPETIGQLHNLLQLDMTDCSELASLPDSIGKLKRYVVLIFLPILCDKR
jgi:hypothetical protein